jgi:protein-disulfide isomerase/uncharacterized membrane protein
VILTAASPASSLLTVSDKQRSMLLALVVLVALLGVADGVYLTIVHIEYDVGKAGIGTMCHKLSATGCSVTAGRFGNIYGIPVATIGAGGALATAVLGVIAWMRRAKWEDPYRQALLVLATLSVGASIVMASVSLSEGSWCPFCVAWYVLNAALAWLTWRTRDVHVGWRDAIDDMLGPPAVIAALVFGATVAGTMSWYRSAHDELEAERNAEFVPKLVEELRKDPPREIDITDSPSKGADDPEVTIVEFGDFQCPHCAKLFHGVEEYAKGSSRRVKIVFAHYPLGQSCNPNVDDRHKFACGAAIASECAGQQGKFWEYATTLFDNQDDLEPTDLREYAKDTGLDIEKYDRCLVDPAAAARVHADVERGAKVEITGTPTFLINGYKWTGAMPPSLLAGVIDRLLEVEPPTPH